MSNLGKHLESKHNIYAKANAIKESNQRKLTDIFLSSGKKRKSIDGTSQTKANQQYIFNRQIALWLCRDLLPFNTVETEGFREFWHTMKHTPDLPLPCRATVALSALDDLYDCFKKKLTDILATTTDHATITFDCWTDSAKRTAYITYTYHYMNDWKIQTAVLKTAMLAKPHTGERLRENFEEMLEEYDLTNKKISVVTDGGSNIVKACKSMKILRFGCIGHIIHNTITRDLMKNTSVQVIIDLVAHIRQIQRKLLYKNAELRKIYNDEQQSRMWTLLEDFIENG